MPRPEKPIRKFDAKIMSILPNIERGKDEKSRVRGQDKWGLMLRITKGKNKGEEMALWGHCIKPAKKARIGKLKIGEKLHITMRSHRDWSWKRA